MDNAARLITIILLASFATERLLACISWYLDAEHLEDLEPDEARKARAARKRKVTLLLVGAAISVGVVQLTGIRILAQLALGKVAPALDYVMTWFVLFAGADKIRDLMGGAGKGGGSKASAPAETPAIRIVIDRDGEVEQISRVS